MTAGERIAQQVHHQAATPLQLLAFGNTDASDATLDTLKKIFGRLDWPVTWVEGAACDGNPVAGIQIRSNGELSGLKWTAADVHCQFGFAWGGSR